MYSIGIAASILGVCIKTLRRWHRANKIYCVRTLGGHRRFSHMELLRLLEGRCNKGSHCENTGGMSHKCAIYGRVSSHKQYKRGDLERQVQYLKDYAHCNHLEIYKVYKDIASGLNTKRKGLLRLLRDAKKQKFSLIIVTYKDRLTRFGYSYLEQYVSEFDVKITNLKRLEERSPESEMIEDLVAIIHSFSGKLYRLRATT
jgi:putative resolvase